MELLKKGSLKLVRIESLRPSSSSASCDKTVKKETKSTKAAKRRGNTVVLSSDDEDDEEIEPHNYDDFDSGSTVVVDEGSNFGDLESYVDITFQLLKCPAKLKKLQLKGLELQTLNNALGNSNIDLSRKIKETKKEYELAGRNSKILLEKLGKLEAKELEVKEMKTKCSGLETKDKETTRKYGALEQQNKEMRTKYDRLERENKELSRKYAASERKREEITAEAYTAISKAVSEGCDP